MTICQLDSKVSCGSGVSSAQQFIRGEMYRMRDTAWGEWFRDRWRSPWW